MDGLTTFHFAGIAATVAAGLCTIALWAHGAYRRYHLRRAVLRRLEVL